ncbi:MAG: hypothetical protein ACOX9R_02030 [Armatimonadota bacterium]|jgi:hypothetical protein
MGRWQALAIVTALTLAALPAVGQTQYPAPGLPEVPGDAAQLHEDVQILRTLRTLELTAEQRAELQRINAAVTEQQRSLEQLRGSEWTEYQDEIEEVLEAWMNRRTPSSRARLAADRAVNRVNDSQTNLQTARWRAAQTLYNELTVAQRSLVEAPGAAEERMARTARMGAVDSVGQYVLIELDAIRDLMPDEFMMLAASEAQRIARAIVGPNAANLPQATDVVFDILVQVYDWTPDRYREQRGNLPAQIEALLGFESAAQRPPVSWNDLMRLATSNRTTAALAAITEAGGGEVE